MTKWFGKICYNYENKLILYLFMAALSWTINGYDFVYTCLSYLNIYLLIYVKLGLVVSMTK